MPAWWRGKSKSSPNSTKKGKQLLPPAAAEVKPGKKEKAKSFDEAVARRNGNSPRGGGGGGSGSGNLIFSFDSDAERKTCHPLPRPVVLSSTSMPNDHGSATGASASVSSVSSSGSSEDAPDLGYRYTETVGMPRGRSVIPHQQRQQHAVEERQQYPCSPVLQHESLANILVSPRKNAQRHVSDNSSNGTLYSHHVAPKETVFNQGSRSPGPRSRGYTLFTSPVKCRQFSGTGLESPIGKREDMRSPPHPLPLPPSSPTSPVSRSLQSKYKKGKLLGRGTFGHVYAGFNSENGQMFAIKEVEVISDDSNSKECLKQLAQEINLLSQLSHPNIVQYYGSELIDDTLSVYLEYVSGGSIHKLLQDYGPFKEPVIRSYAGQILSGLVYLHGMNTIHRDIKGANILVDPNGEIKLADFGMAKHISSYTSIRSFKGSPYWMAPEVIMNTNGYSLPVDIWSLGCTIIEMATARPPWSQYTGVQAIFKIGNSKDIPEIPEHISNDGKSFLKLCLQRDPSARPTAAQLMDHPFVRDQAKIKISNGNIIRDACPSSDGCRSLARSVHCGTDGTWTVACRQTTTDVAYNRSNSPLRDNRDYMMRHTTTGYNLPYKNPSDLVSLRMNMSLPVSPCSSPLRQFQQSNWSCLPSPPHPMGTVSYGPSDHSLYPLGSSSRYTEHWPEIPQVNALTSYGSPRR